MKKIALLCLLATASLAASAQRYTISGKATAGSAYAYFRNLESKTTDSVAVAADGSFRFEGDAKGRPFARVGDATRKLNVVLDGDVVVDLTTNTIGGTRENERYGQVWQRVMTLQDSVQTLIPALRSADRKSDAFKQLYAQYEMYVETMVGTMKRAVLDNSDALFPAIILNESGSLFEAQDLRDIAAQNAPYFQQNLLAPLRAEIEASARRAPGRAFTDFTMADTKGVVRKLSSFVGKKKYVLVDFWASWCGPCRREMPAVKALYDKYKAKGFDIVGVSLDEDKAAWTGAIQTLKANWNHLSDLKGWNNAAARLYGVRAIPATILIGPDGKITHADVRAEELAEILKGIYGE